MLASALCINFKTKHFTLFAESFAMYIFVYQNDVPDNLKKRIMLEKKRILLSRDSFWTTHVTGYAHTCYTSAKQI